MAHPEGHPVCTGPLAQPGVRLRRALRALGGWRARRFQPADRSESPERTRPVRGGAPAARGGAGGSAGPGSVLSGVTAVSVGSSGATCALMSGETVACWGFGAVGNGTKGSATPVVVPGLSSVTQIAAGDGQVCVLETGETIECWGSNLGGELGQGASALAPVAVTGFGQVGQIAEGGLDFACALLGDGSVECWGSNLNGDLQCGATTASAVPLKIAGLQGVKALATAIRRACVVSSNGTVDCWGGDWPCTPTAVAGITNATTVAVGTAHMCALLMDGTVACWGTNQYGQLGDASTTDSPMTPVKVAGLADVVEISAGDFFVCALIKDGSVKCWGDSRNGELGNGTTTMSPTPIVVPGLGGVTALSAALAIKRARCCRRARSCAGVRTRRATSALARRSGPTCSAPAFVLAIGVVSTDTLDNLLAGSII